MLLAVDGFEVVQVLSPVLALAITLASFWWLYLQPGKLHAAPPKTFASFRNSWPLPSVLDQPEGPRSIIRFPLAILNTGAAGVAVVDLRAVVNGKTFRWESTRPAFWGPSNDEYEMAAPFTIGGRQAKLLFPEFKKLVNFDEVDDGDHEVRIECQYMRRSMLGRVQSLEDPMPWELLVAFDWWWPQHDQSVYMPHRIEVGGCTWTGDVLGDGALADS